MGRAASSAVPHLPSSRLQLAPAAALRTCTPSILHALRSPGALLAPQDLFGGADGAAFAAAAAAGLNSADDSLPYSTSELNAPEYSTDEFRMFQFKVSC